jgi:hypothetical protein
MPPESSVVIPREEHIANVELEECEPQPDGHVIAVDIVWVHSVLHALTTRSASFRTPWSLCDEQRQRGNSLCGKPPPKAATRKRCANVKSEAEASQRDWVAGAPPEQLPARAALIWWQIGRLAPREPGEIRGLVTPVTKLLRLGLRREHLRKNLLKISESLSDEIEALGVWC